MQLMGNDARHPHEVVQQLLDDPRMITACQDHDAKTIFRMLNHRGASTRAIAECVDISQGRYFEYVRENKPHKVEKFALIEKIADGLRIPGEMLRLARRSWESTPDDTSHEPTDKHGDSREDTYELGIDDAMWLAHSARPSLAIATGLQASIEDYWRRDDQYGGEAVRPGVVGQLDYALKLLDECRETRLAYRLHQVTAELARLAGWLFFDAARHSTACHHFVQAMRLARAIDDRPFMANILACMSLQATYQAKPRDALMLAHAAQDCAGRTGPARVLSMLRMREAFAHAALGDVRACHAALGSAHQAFDAAQSTADDPAWVRYFDQSKLAVDTGIARARLGEYKRGASAIEQALRGSDTTNVRGRAFHFHWLAAAHLKLGNLEEACDHAMTSYALASRVESARVANHVTEFRSQLNPYGAERPVIELRARWEADERAE